LLVFFGFLLVIFVVVFTKIRTFIVVGEKEVESGTLSVRIRGQNEKETLTAEQLIVKVSEKIVGKPFKPLPLPMYLSKRPQFHG